jgi:hypothetical protein
MVAATRQKAGRSLYAMSSGWRRSEKEDGGAKAPGATEADIVIAVCGSASLARLSHGVALIAQAANRKIDPVKKVKWFFGRLVIMLLQSVSAFLKRTQCSLTQF